MAREREQAAIASPSIQDTGVFDGDRYFDVEVEYAKAAPTTCSSRITVTNRGARARAIDVLAAVLVSQHVELGGRRRRTIKPELAADHASRRRSDVVEGTEQFHLGRRLPLRRGRERAPLHRQRDEHARALRDAEQRAAVREGRVPSRDREGRARTRRTRRDAGTKVGGALRRSMLGPGRDREDSRCGSATSTSTTNRSPTSTRSFAARKREADEFYDAIMPRRARPTTSDACSARRSRASSGRSSTTTSTSSAGCAATRSRRRRRGAQARAESRVDAPLQQRGALDARQVGVPLVRGVGPRVPLHPDRARRSGVREAAARPADA